MILYTDIEPFCCEVLRARVEDGGLLPGEVWERDIATLTAEELEPFTQIHLFAGIGASPLGFRWAGWPAEWSLVTGGFPCQDISSAGKGAGLDGKRSGLFWEMLRVIDIKRPAWVLAENVGALSARGLDRVAGALGALGYQVEALRLGAWAVGAPHERERWWIVAHVRGARRETDEQVSGGAGHRVLNQAARGDQSGVSVVNTIEWGRQRGSHEPERGEGGRAAARGTGADSIELADAVRIESRDSEASRWNRARGSASGAGGQSGVAQGNAEPARLEGHGIDAGESEVSEPRDAGPRFENPGRWPAPYLNGPSPQHEWEFPRLYSRGMAGLADGIPDRLASALNKCGVAATGNAQVPQCVEVIARAMMESVK